MTERISFNEVLDDLNTMIDIDRIYPKEDSRKVSLENLTTIGMRLSKDQALKFAGYLTLAASKGWNVFDITGYRKPKKNGLYKVTITTER